MKKPVPSATYRVQLTRDFGFREAAAILPYLDSLGISTLYCSPVLQARAGSTHGYDVADPTRLNEELGGAEGWEDLCRAARALEMTLLLDIVPNHMAATVENPWWLDVLEHGRISPYENVFDIDWIPSDRRPRNRVLLPVLSQPLHEALDSGSISVGLSETGLVLKFGQSDLPLSVRSYGLALAPLLELPQGTVPEPLIRAVRLASVLARVSEMDLLKNRQLHYELTCSAKNKVLANIVSQDGAIGTSGTTITGLVRHTLSHLTRTQLRRILTEQCYTLEYWKKGLSRINYRRFFDISDLVGVRVEDPAVFDLTHRELRNLAGSGAVCGFRVDHVDGLRYPQRYLRRLSRMRVIPGQGKRGSRPYVVVEKILSGNEELQPEWAVHGTTGYEFLNMVNGIFVDPTGLPMLEKQHQRLTRTRVSRIDLVHRNKGEVCRALFKGEFLRLARLIEPLAPAPPARTRDRISLIVDSLVTITAHLPVYRTYLGHGLSMSEQDIKHLKHAAVTAQSHTATPEQYLYLVMVHRVLTVDLPTTLRTPRVLRYCAEVARLWQQLSGAVMAKGFEDTTLYQDSVLLSLNEVGSAHERAAVSLERFHRWNAQRLREWPDSLNCTATHDTKRGEDARARLNVISEMADDWNSICSRWLPFVRKRHPRVDASTALFLLQTILSTWPDSDSELPQLHDRVTSYSVKAAREAKRFSSWIEPDHEYEHALGRLVAAILTGEMGDDSLNSDLQEFRRLLSFHGAVNSIAQVILKITCPGVPDFYQGTELWDLSMVDPDNRRPVDYAMRSRLVHEARDVAASPSAFLEDALKHWPESEAKLYVTWKALQLRQAHREVFHRGTYVPLYADDRSRSHVCAYSRGSGDTHVLVLAPVRSISLSGKGSFPIGERTWRDNSVVLPPGIPTTYRDVLTDRCLAATGGRLMLAEVFERFPAAILVGHKRQAPC